MQVCTSLQTDNHAGTPTLSFYRPDALPAAQPSRGKINPSVNQWHKSESEMNMGQLFITQTNPTDHLLDAIQLNPLCIVM